MTNNERWRRVVGWLRKVHPPHLPITVHQVEPETIDKKYGHTWLDDDAGYLRIEINKRKWFGQKLDTVLHEWAHALTWFGAETNYEDHSAEWGIAYAKVYRTFLRWYCGKPQEPEE